MTLRSRILFTFTFLIAVGFWFLVSWVVDEIRPRYKESVEEVLVDVSQALAQLATPEDGSEIPNVEPLQKIYQKLQNNYFVARIYEMDKHAVDMRVYLTDAQGIVLFDSTGKYTGQNFSAWRDVLLTLAGEYGARTTRDSEKDLESSILYVAAPVRKGNKIIGVLSVGKPTTAINTFTKSVQPQFWIAGLVAALSVIFLGSVLTFWITHPIHKLTTYALKVRDGIRAIRPRLGSAELEETSQAIDQMRESLENKKYVERTVQTLTHEIKSPLAAIRGAAEILEENPPIEKRERFLKNILGESQRIQDLVDRMLELASLESRRHLEKIEDIKLTEVIKNLANRLAPSLESKALTLKISRLSDLIIQGEKFLIEQALRNIFQNAIEFSLRGTIITVELILSGEEVILSIRDVGVGIPDWAKARIFDKFYSLQHPDTGRKGTGLGLAFVKEVMNLHGAAIVVRSVEGRGTEVELRFPKSFNRR